MSGHIPVLLDECIKYLNIRPDGVYVDGTLGMGGHSEAILQRLTTGRLIAIDRDAEAVRRASARLAPYAAGSASSTGISATSARYSTSRGSPPWTGCYSTSA